MAGIALVFISLMINGSIALQARGLEREIRQLSQQRSLLQQEINKLQEYAAIHVQVEKVESLLAKALGTEPDWEEVLTNLSLSIPTELWLTDFSAVYDGKKGELVLRGFAFTHHSVGAWLERLQELEELADVQCLFTVATESGGRPVVQFEISAVILLGTPAAGRKGM
ncbi:MAG: PilN domain-containing protein [Bacillota bacterium]